MAAESKARRCGRKLHPHTSHHSRENMNIINKIINGIDAELA